MSQLNITRNFATPIASMKLQNSEAFNSELKAYIMKISSDADTRNDLPTQPERDDLYESKFDLFNHDNPAIVHLKELTHSYLKELIMKLNNYPDEVRDSLQINEHAWYHITQKHGYFTSHNHPMASWSCIYCIDGGGRPDDYPESAVTRFFHPNNNANYYMDAGNANFVPEFAVSSLNFTLEAGDLVFFPSHLMHEVSVHKGDRPRITVAVNFWIDSDYVKVRV